MTFLCGDIKQSVQLWFVQLSGSKTKTSSVLEHRSIRKIAT